MKYIITLFLIIFKNSFQSKTSFLKQIPLKNKNEIIDITPYDYPKKTDEDSDEYNIVLFGTTDIHGNYFPKNNSMPNKKGYYQTGGLQYMASFFDVFRKDFGDRSMYLDAGDQFQGGLETRISNGSIMTEFYNIMDLNSSTLGNHEFDFGLNYLKKRSNESKFEYVIGNILDPQGKDVFLPKNQVTYKTYQIGKIKAGVIGLVTTATKQTSGQKDIKDFEFLDYRNVIKTYSDKLKEEEKVDVVILLSHFGTRCVNSSEVYEKYTLNIYNSSYKGLHCNPNEELELLLKNLEPNLIDVVVSGHTHDNVHQYVHGYPVISTVNNGRYFNAMYLYFDKIDGKYIFNPNKTIIEGPIPACEKVFLQNKRCEIFEDEKMSSYEMYNYKFHNTEIIKNPKLDELSKKWWDEYQNYVKQILCYLKGTFEKKNEEEHALGNFFTDFIRDVTGADVSIYNGGGFRTIWKEGNISVANVFEMSPFDNNIVTFSMTGEELINMLKQTEESTTYGFYPVSGLKLQILQTSNSKKLISAKLFDGINDIEIEKNKTYKVASNNFLLNGGDDFAKVMKWYKIKDFEDYNDTRDNLIAYLKNVQLINSKNYIDELNPRILVIKETILRRLINKVLKYFK
jgi:2',3'-cyclic-nucleotide 2'-phosphodiesterase/3'-nucleotidase